MARLLAPVLALLAAGVNEVSSVAMTTELKVFSKAEIMATMTVHRASKLVLNSHSVLMRPKLATFLKTELEKVDATGMVQLREVSAHGNGTGATGYAAVDGARVMLNEMMDDSMAKLDNEVEKCTTYNRETLALLEEVRQDVASFNAQAAEARSRVLKSQGTIAFCQLKMPQVQEELDQHNEECAKEEVALQSQIEVVLADIDIVSGIMTIIGDCPAATTTTTAPGLLLQQPASSAAALVQCRHCRMANEGGYMMLQHDTIQPLLNKLHSAVVRSYVQESLNSAYDEAVSQQPAEALTQEEVHHQIAIMKGSGSASSSLRGQRQDPGDAELIASMGNNSGALNISKVPEATVPFDCIPTNKCTLGMGNCGKIRDRFLQIQAGIQDMLTKLKKELAELQRGCLEDKTIMESQIANLGEKLRSAQTDLATATGDQVESESSSNLKGQQHTEITDEYGVEMKECCDEQNDLKSEICALEKIRGEIYKMKGLEIFITDCEVTGWSEGRCSSSCGGGYLVKSRSIMVHPVKGMKCPPLELKESCNTHPCPIDCIVGEWEGWSGCSAECGGGIRERMRPVLTEMKHDGSPCEDTEETEGCNSQSCNKECELADWTDWGSCTQACWTGTNRRDRAVEHPARGTGSCPEPAGDHRLQFRNCNDKPCSEFYQQGTLHHVTSCSQCSYKNFCNSAVWADNSPDAEAGYASGNSLSEWGCDQWKGQKIVRNSKSGAIYVVEEGVFLKCASKIDMVVLMDGSGSLGEEGWEKSKKLVTNLISHLKEGDDTVRVALQLFSGPTTWDNYYKCTGASPTAGAPDLEKDCGIRWIKHFSNNTMSVPMLKTALQWPSATTLTSVALAEAQAELMYGREDAASIVVVITDGKPMSQDRTVQAAHALMAKARIIWVPIGPGAPVELVEELASFPKHENVIHVDDFAKLAWPYFANKIIAQTCPVLAPKIERMPAVAMPI